jgi:hypothetical protein
VSAEPGANAARANVYQAFLSLADPAREAAFARLYPYDIAPAVDDRPFFFKYSRWSHLWADRENSRIAFPAMEWSVLLLLGATSLAGALGVLLPLRSFASRGLAAPGASRVLLFFAGTGLGYLAIEVALLQKFGLLLGHPNYALSVVLATLLLATGLGALSASTIARRLGGLRFVVYLLAGLMLAEYSFLFPRLPACVGFSFAVRLLIVVAAVAPLGILLGTFVPIALDHLKQRAAALVPWAWGVNGIASVIAPLLAAAFSMTWGIGALFLSAIPLYLVVALVAPDPAPAVAASARYRLGRAHPDRRVSPRARADAHARGSGAVAERRAPRRRPTSSSFSPTTWAGVTSAATASRRSRRRRSTRSPRAACASRSTTRATRSALRRAACC